MGELKPSNEDEIQIIEKRPYRWMKFAVSQIIDIAVPLHLKALKTHSENIKQFELHKDWQSLHAEQICASNTVRLLKSDIYELQSLRSQIRDEDTIYFQQKTEPATEEVLNALALFLQHHPHIMSKQPKLPEELASSSTNIDFIPLICDPNIPASENFNQQLLLEKPPEDLQVVDANKVRKRWLKLQSELSEVAELFRKFASIVFSQKERVSTIEDNIQSAQENVEAGTSHLRKAAILQAAALPATGAVIGGLLLGPVGAAAGFKIFGSVACALSGCALGYGAGWKIKQQRQKSCDFEMKALTYSSKTLSTSTPDVSEIPQFALSDYSRPENQENNSD